MTKDSIKANREICLIKAVVLLCEHFRSHGVNSPPPPILLGLRRGKNAKLNWINLAIKSLNFKEKNCVKENKT